MTLNRPRPLALFLFLACFGTTLALGTWQVQRLQWKTNLIAEIDAAKLSAPLTSIPADADELTSRAFYPITLRGKWLDGTEFHLSPRFYKSKLGYFVITPFLLDDGRTLLVNRGWIPAAQKEAASRPDSMVKGKATIHGLIRLGNERNYFTPANQPAKNIWFGRDIEQMAATAQLKNTIPAMVDLVGTQDAKILPVPSDGTIRLTNDHLSYIITWYGIALGILVIFMLTLRKKHIHE
jgi:surfeit locus 1 family protein